MPFFGKTKENKGHKAWSPSIEMTQNLEPLDQNAFHHKYNAKQLGAP
jgi:hypothetical protein